MSFEAFYKFKVFEWKQIPFPYIRHYYLPYGSEYKDPERRLAEAISQKEKIAVEGNRGSGKTSLINFVISGLNESYLPITFPIRMESRSDSKKTSASDFCAFMLTRIESTFRAADELAARIDMSDFEQYRKFMLGEVQYREGSQSSLAVSGEGSAGLPGFIGATLSVSGEIRTFVERAFQGKIYTEDQVECINRIVEMCRAKGAEPVFILDDTDKLLRSLAHLVDDFSLFVIPFLGDIDCAVVLPVHSQYYESESFLDASSQVFDSRVRIPTVDSVTFERMIDKRVRCVLDSTRAREFFEEEAIKLVYEARYADRDNPENRLRHSMLAFHQASAEAFRNRESLVTRTSMEFCLTDIS